MDGVDFATEFEQARQEFVAQVTALAAEVHAEIAAAERERALRAELDEAWERIGFLEQLLWEVRERAASRRFRRDLTLVSVIDAALRKGASNDNTE